MIVLFGQKCAGMIHEENLETAQDSIISTLALLYYLRYYLLLVHTVLLSPAYACNSLCRGLILAAELVQMLAVSQGSTNTQIILNDPVQDAILCWLENSIIIQTECRKKCVFLTNSPYS